MRAHLARFSLTPAGVAGALEKGGYRVRDFGGVFVFLVTACVRTWTLHGHDMRDVRRPLCYMHCRDACMLHVRGTPISVTALVHESLAKEHQAHVIFTIRVRPNARVGKKQT